VRLAVIPARGGSKRIPRKNIRNFYGKPIIAWSLEAARATGLFDHIIVSTDDAEIAAVSKDWGGEVPFIRPVNLSDDYVGTTPVMSHATRWACDQGWDIEAVCCLYPTAPFVRPADLTQGLQVLLSGGWSYTFSATDFAAPIFRAFKQTPDGGTEMFFPEQFLTRSQDLPMTLHDAGQFYWGRADAWLNEIRIFSGSSSPILIPRWRVQDIDTFDDWKRAEIIAPVIFDHVD
jgi:N-acylneuraminate cytidylyltransferase